MRINPTGIGVLLIAAAVLAASGTNLAMRASFEMMGWTPAAPCFGLSRTLAGRWEVTLFETTYPVRPAVAGSIHIDRSGLSLVIGGREFRVPRFIEIARFGGR